MKVNHGANLYDLSSQYGFSKEDFMDFSSNINPFGSSKLAKKYVINNDLKAIYYAMEDKFYVATYSKRDRYYINKLLLANYKEYIKFDDAMCFEQNVLFDFAESGCYDFNYFIED